MAVERRGRSLRIAFSIDGTLHKVRWPGGNSAADIQAAERVQSRVRRDIQDGVFTRIEDYLPATQAASKQLFGPYAQHWLDNECSAGVDTRHQYVLALNRYWLPLLAGERLSRLTPFRIKEAVREALQDVPGAATRNNYKVPLRLILKAAFVDELVERDLAPFVKAERVETPDPDPFTSEEVEQILAAFKGQHLENWFTFMFFSGLRTGEGLALEWRDIDLEAGTAHICRSHTAGTTKQRTKTSKPRTIYLHPRALAALKAQQPRTRLMGGRVFRREDGKPYQREWVQRDALYKVLDRLGIRRRPAYNSRHTYATMMIMAGVNIHLVADQMGHSVATLHRHYAKWLQSDSDRAELSKLFQASPNLPQGAASK